MSSPLFQFVKIIPSIEGCDDINLNEFRSKCVINLFDSISIDQVKELIKKYYFIPTDCDFDIAPFVPFHPQLEEKKIITDSSDLKQKLRQYVTETDLYSEFTEAIVRLHLYPIAFLTIPIVFTVQDNYPGEGNVDFPLTRVIQGFPLCFIHYAWADSEIIAQFQRLIFQYIYSAIPSEKDTNDHLQLQVQIFNSSGEEHKSLDSIINNEPMVVKINSSIEPLIKKLRKHFETLEWVEFPLTSFQQSPRRAKSDSAIILAPTISQEENYFTPRQSFSESPSPDLSHLKPHPDDSSFINKACKENESSTKELAEELQNLGVNLTAENLFKLSTRSSTIEGAVNYYFENMDLFSSDSSSLNLKHSNESDVVIPLPLDIVQAEILNQRESLLKEEDHEKKEAKPKLEEDQFDRSSSYEIITAEDYEELPYFEADEFPTAEAYIPSAPPQPPAENSLRPISTFIPTPSKNMTPAKRFYYQFKEMGIELNDVQIEELILRASTFDGMINYYLSNLPLFHPVPNISQQYCQPVSSSSHLKGREERKRSDSPMAEKQCVICFTDYNVEEEMYSLNCSENHYFCLTCLVRLISIAVKGSEDTAPYIPACPFANRPITNGGCEYAIPQAECEQILTLAMNSPKLDVISYEEGEELLKKCRQLYLLQAYRQANCVRCPSCPAELGDEGYWVSLPPSTINQSRKVMMRVDCPTCYASFCSSCLKFPYHFGCSCDDVLPYMRAWMEFIATGRQRYLQELAKHEEKFRQVLQEYETKRKEHEKSVKEAEDRFKEYQESETALARFCKSCPHCGCRIEKIDGCDSMMCGHDAHGRSIGLGCGKGFSWNAAPPYVPKVGSKKMPEEFNMVAPDKVSSMVSPASIPFHLPYLFRHLRSIMKLKKEFLFLVIVVVWRSQVLRFNV